MNQFPHAFLNPIRRETIPMSLVYIFVAVARRLGVQAWPANFPGVVQAHIQPADPLDAPRLLDMRGKDEPVLFAAGGYLSAHPPTSGPDRDVREPTGERTACTTRVDRRVRRPSTLILERACVRWGRRFVFFGSWV